MLKMMTISSTSVLPTIVRERMVRSDWDVIHMGDAYSFLLFENINVDAIIWYIESIELEHIRTAQNIAKKFPHAPFLILLSNTNNMIGSETISKNATMFRLIRCYDDQIEAIDRFLESILQYHKASLTNVVEIYPNITFNFDLHCLINNGKALPLPRKEYDLLIYLIKNRTRFVTIEQILHAVWDEYTSPETARQYIYKLRKKLETDKTDGSLLIHRKGIGYMLFGQGTQFLDEKITFV